VVDGNPRRVSTAFGHALQGHHDLDLCQRDILKNFRIGGEPFTTAAPHSTTRTFYCLGDISSTESWSPRRRAS
jgi:hypothetical protein